MADRKITAEDLRRQVEANDALKAMGDENFVKALEDIAEKVSDVDVNELLKDMNQIINED